MNKKKAGIIFILFGFLMLASAVLFYANYQKREAEAEQHSLLMLQEFRANIMQPLQPLPPQANHSPADEAIPFEEIIYPEMATADYYGLAMIGIIRAPSCGVELPVLSDWSYTMLEYAPCRYSGNIYAGDLILMGHNYSCHFKPLKKLEIGAEVEFEDANGTIWKYRVDGIDSIHRNDVDALPSDHDLILFTCEEYGVYRFVARCSLVETVELEQNEAE